MVEIKVYDPLHPTKVVKKIVVNNPIYSSFFIGNNHYDLRNDSTAKSKLTHLNDVTGRETYSITIRCKTDGDTDWISRQFMSKDNKWFDYNEFNKYYVRCAYCGKATLKNDKHRLRGSNERYIGERGGNRYYYCDSCWDNIIPKNPLPFNIYNYHEYNNVIKFVKHRTQKEKESVLQIGVELEIEFGDSCERHSSDVHNDNARTITAAGGFDCATEDMFITSHDCSLHDGFEIISQPMSMLFHKNIAKWDALLAKAQSLGYKSHNGGHCGLHMHVNRDFFKGNRDEAEDKITAIVMNNKYWLVPFSRRRNWSYCAFPNSIRKLKGKKYFLSKDVNSNEVYTGDTRTNLCNAKSQLRGHGSAMNYSNQNTIEFRFMRGTLRARTFFASMEMVQMTCEMANMFTKAECANVNLQTFCLFARERGYKNFLGYVEDLQLEDATILSSEGGIEDGNVDGSAKAEIHS